MAPVISRRLAHEQREDVVAQHLAECPDHETAAGACLVSHSQGIRACENAEVAMAKLTPAAPTTATSNVTHSRTGSRTDSEPTVDWDDAAKP